MNQEFLELCKKKKVDKEYLKLQKDLTNPSIRSATYCRIGDLAVKLKDFNYALNMYESATKCKQNVPNDVYYTLGNVYLYGTFNKDVTKNIFMEKDIKKTIEIYKKIEDIDEANKLIGYIYYYGLGDSKKKYRKAFKMFKKLSTPCLELGHLYFYGKGMLKKNRYKALEIYSSLKFNKDDEVCNNFITTMKKVELFTLENNLNIDLEISNYYLKVLSYKKNHDLIYDFSEILRPLDKNKDVKKVLVKYYKEYLKLVDKIGNRNVARYINAYEYVTPESKRDTFEYKVMKAELGEEKYYFEVGLAYAQGYLMDINKEKSNKYLSKHLSYLEYNLNNLENAKNYIYLCGLLNKDNEKNIYYLEAKALLDDNEYILKTGLAYLYGNITTKDINKARYYLNIYLKTLEPYINENNLSKLASYTSIYESIHEPNDRKDFKYYLAKALLNDPYYKLLVGIAYEEGVIVEKDLEKAKKYIKESYEGGFKGAYNKYQEYFNPKTNYSNSVSMDMKKANECIKSLELDPSKELTLDSIKSQFRKLSKIYHPDLANSMYKDGKKFIEINEAYNYLNKNYEEINKNKK